MITKKCFKRYGQPGILVKRGEGVEIIPVHAFIQPLRYKNKLYLRGRYTEIGKNKEDYYLYIGPPDVDISETDGSSVQLVFADKEYLVYRTEYHTVAGKDVYQWAIIRPVTTDNETDESDDEEAVG